jgi:hypothetical protein
MSPLRRYAVFETISSKLPSGVSKESGSVAAPVVRNLLGNDADINERAIGLVDVVRPHDKSHSRTSRRWLDAVHLSRGLVTAECQCEVIQLQLNVRRHAVEGSAERLDKSQEVAVERETLPDVLGVQIDHRRHEHSLTISSDDQQSCRPVTPIAFGS